MKTRDKVLGFLALVVFGAVLGGPVEADPLFSIDAASPSVPGVSPADILSPGPLGGPPVVVIGAAVLGLVAGDDVDAISYGMSPTGTVTFSVDRLAVGVVGPFPPDVFTEAAAGQAAGDIFTSPPPPGGPNTLLTNQSALGLLPAVAPGVGVAPPIDNLDALEFQHPVMPTPAGLLYSLAAGSPTLGLIGASPADILTTGIGGPVVAVAAAALGLVPVDDIDALVYDVAGMFAYFSLAPGSPTLLATGFGPGDILGCAVGCVGPPGLFIPGATLGLAAGDNLDALSANPIPEPSTLLLLGSSLLGAASYGWRRGRRESCDRS